MKKTKLGKAMRAVSDNKDVAQTVGIKPLRRSNKNIHDRKRIGRSRSGILIGIEQNLYPTMGMSLAIK